MTETEPTDIHHHFGGGVYIKQSLIPAGHVLVQHKHKYEHMTILASGRAVVDGVELCGPKVFVIPPEKNHGARTITDCLWFCVHATEVRDPSVMEQILVIPQSKDEILELAGKV
jgi:hypothetical protein